MRNWNALKQTRLIITPSTIDARSHRVSADCHNFFRSSDLVDEQGFAVSISTAKTSRQVETFHEARARTTHLEKNLRSVLIWAINLIRPIGIKTDALRLQNNQPSLLIMATMALICCAQCGHMHSSLRINCPQCKVVVWHKGIDRSDQSRRCGMPQRAALDKRTSRKTKAV